MTADHEADALRRELVDLQCRFMDLELLVSELNEVIIDLGEQLTRGERERRGLARRVAQLEQGSEDADRFGDSLTSGQLGDIGPHGGFGGGGLGGG